MTGRIDMRPLASTFVHRRARDGWLRTVLPRPALSILGAEHPVSVSWTRAGRYYRVVPSERRLPGSDSVKNRVSNTVRIPAAAARDLRAVDGGYVDWFVSAGPPGWHLLARRPSRVRYAPAASGGGAGRMSRRLVATGRVVRHGGWSGTHVETTVPPACLRLLLADDTGYVKWSRTGSYYRMIPCGSGDLDARRLTRRSNEKDHVSRVAYLPKPVADFAYSGKNSRLGWYVAADRAGRWEIHARPEGRK